MVERTKQKLERRERLNEKDLTGLAQYSSNHPLCQPRHVRYTWEY